MILLSRSYMGYLAGTIIQLGTQEEAALIAQGLATNSTGPVTPGAVTTTKTFGRVGIAASSASVVVTCPSVTAESKVFAVVAQAAADVSFLRVERVLCAVGSFTIYGTANATAAVVIDWALVDTTGGLTVN